jgi:hypothetical protein
LSSSTLADPFAAERVEPGVNAEVDLEGGGAVASEEIDGIGHVCPGVVMMVGGPSPHPLVRGVPGLVERSAITGGGEGGESLAGGVLVGLVVADREVREVQASAGGNGLVVVPVAVVVVDRSAGEELLDRYHLVRLRLCRRCHSASSHRDPFHIPSRCLPSAARRFRPKPLLLAPGWGSHTTRPASERAGAGHGRACLDVRRGR